MVYSALQLKEKERKWKLLHRNNKIDQVWNVSWSITKHIDEFGIPPVGVTFRRCYRACIIALPYLVGSPSSCRRFAVPRLVTVCHPLTLVSSLSSVPLDGGRPCNASKYIEVPKW